MRSCDGWRPVVGREGAYEVSRCGRVRKVSDGTILRAWANGDGYLFVRLSQPRTTARVHRMVAEAFLPNPEGYPAVNHIDNCRSNNAVENLEWCTQAQNLAHARKQGRMYSHPKGTRSLVARLTDEEVKAIRSLYAGGSVTLRQIAAAVGLSHRSVGRLINGESYADV